MTQQKADNSTAPGATEQVTPGAVSRFGKLEFSN